MSAYTSLFGDEDALSERPRVMSTPPAAPAAPATLACTVREGYLVDARAADTPAQAGPRASPTPPARLWVTTWQDEGGFCGEACMEGLQIPPITARGLDSPFELHLAGRSLHELLAPMTQDDVIFDGEASACAVLQELIQGRRQRAIDAHEARALYTAMREFAQEFRAVDATDFDVLLATLPDNAGVESLASQSLVEDPVRFHRWKEAPQVSAWKDGWPTIAATLRAIGERQQQALREQAGGDNQARPRSRG